MAIALETPAVPTLNMSLCSEVSIAFRYLTSSYLFVYCLSPPLTRWWVLWKQRLFYSPLYPTLLADSRCSINIPWLNKSLPCVHVCMLSRFSHVWLIVTLWTIAHQAPLSMGILQATILEKVVMPSSRGSSQLRNWTHVSCGSCITDGFFTTEAQVIVTELQTVNDKWWIKWQETLITSQKF